MASSEHSSGRLLQAFITRIGAESLVGAFARLTEDAAVFVVDEERRVVHWSEGATQLLGYSAAEAVGEHCLKTNRCMQCVRACGISEHGRVTNVPLTLFDKEGREVAVRKSAVAIRDEDGRFLGGLEVLRPAASATVNPVAPEHAVVPSATPVLRPAGMSPTVFHGMSTSDPRMRDLFKTVRHVAETEGTVLVRGESGTGKELVARALHAESHRRDGPFVAINCAAVSSGLLESELFGHVRGAFTGAVRDRDGVFARADRGTLFLDEVAELPLELQAKLLRVLQERSFVPVGGTRSRAVDVRIVAATHQSLRSAVSEGRFREDLMYRLRVIPLYLPPLRERRGDLELLFWSFLERRGAEVGRQVDAVEPDAMRALLDHAWPGNVRELQNVVEYALAVSRGPTLGLHDLPPEFREGAAPIPADRASRELHEKAQIVHALERAEGHIGKAAELLGMSRPTFWRKRKKYGI